MRSFYKIDMLDISLNMLEFAGEMKNVASRKLITFRIFNYIVLILILFDVFINFNYVNGEYYVKTLQSVFYLSQLLLKYALLITQKQTLRFTLNNMLTKFWNYRNFGKYWVIRTQKIYKRARYIQITWLVLSALALYTYFINSGFVVECYLPKSEILDALLLLSQIYYSWIALLIVSGYDFIYFTSCIHVVLQLRLLKQKIRETLNKHDKNSQAIMCECIKHHQDLISTFSSMKSTYSVMLLYHYLTTLITTCIVLLELFLRNIDTVNYAVEIFAVVYLLGQFGMYSFSAEHVAFEFSDISDAIYSSEWYRKSVKLQKLILCVMMKSQRPQNFSGAGLIDINIAAFDSVVRKAFSLCAVLQKLLSL